MLTILPFATLLVIIFGTSLDFTYKTAIFIIYVSTVRYFRYKLRNINNNLDPKTQATEINENIFKDFKFLYAKAMEVGLIQAFSSPRISNVFDKSQGFTVGVPTCTQRIEETHILFMEAYLNPGKERLARRLHAFQRINYIHNLYKGIYNIDMIYVMATFLFPTIDYLNKFGYRKLSKNEELALVYNSIYVGKQFGIKNMPETYENYRAFFNNYRKYHCEPAEVNKKVSDAAVGGLLNWIPQKLVPIIQYGLYTLLPQEDLYYLKNSKKPQFLINIVKSVLLLKGQIVRFFFLPRPETFKYNLNGLRIQQGTDPKGTYKTQYDYVGKDFLKDGYQIDQIGSSWKKCVKKGVILKELPHYQAEEPLDRKYFQLDTNTYTLP